jgi:DNA repair protein RadD
MNDMFRVASPRQLRPHQAKAIEMLRHSFHPSGKGNKRVVLQAATGFGKTLTAAKIIESALAKNGKVLFTVPRLSLIDQTVTEFRREGIEDIGVIQANHMLTNPLAKVQVASLQTLARREIPQDFTLVICDECHEMHQVMLDLIDQWQGRHFVGLSATPWAKGMGNYWQDLVQSITIGELIEQGFLSRFVAYAPDVPDLSGVKTVAGDFHEGQAAQIMEGSAIMANVVQTWLEKGGNRPTLLFAVNRAHAKALQEAFIRAGVAAGYCDANTDVIERQHLGNQIRTGEVKVACSVRTLTTGVDWPISCIIDAAPTRSEMLHVQKIGRGLRVNPGTEDCLILDHAGNSLRLGLVTDIHHDTLDTSAKGEKAEAKPKAEKLPKECANCGTLQSGRVCPVCGHERKPQAGVEELDGQLVEVGGGKKVWTREEKQAWWSGIQTIRAARNRSDGWAANTYRDKFGVWPRGLDDARGDATQEMWNFVKAKDIAFAKAREKARGK